MTLKFKLQMALMSEPDAAALMVSRGDDAMNDLLHDGHLDDVRLCSGLSKEALATVNGIAQQAMMAAEGLKTLETEYDDLVGSEAEMTGQSRSAEEVRFLRPAPPRLPYAHPLPPGDERDNPPPPAGARRPARDRPRSPSSDDVLLR